MFLSQLKWLNFLGQNDLIFCLSAPREKIVILTLKVESLEEPKFDPTFWVTGGIKIRPNFLGQNDSIFSLSAPREKIESFWP